MVLYWGVSLHGGIHEENDIYDYIRSEGVGTFINPRAHARRGLQYFVRECVRLSVCLLPRFCDYAQ